MGPGGSGQQQQVQVLLVRGWCQAGGLLLSNASKKCSYMCHAVACVWPSASEAAVRLL